MINLPKNLALTMVNYFPELEILAPLFRFLTDLRVYSIFPTSDIRERQTPDVSQVRLREDGSNLLSVLRDFINDENNSNRQDLYAALTKMVPGINPNNPISVEPSGNYLLATIEHLDGIGSLELGSESDGTVRVLALLTALFDPDWLSLIGIEEPELMIHPGALAYLADIIWAASHRSQIIISTHSPDLISRFAAKSLRFMVLVEGETKNDPLSEV